MTGRVVVIHALDRPDRIADAVRRLPQLLTRLWDAAPPQADLGGLAAEA